MGATVGTLGATDPDSGSTFTYSLTSNPNGFFAISGTTLRTAAAISYAAYRTVPIQVGALLCIDVRRVDCCEESGVRTWY